MPGTAPVSCAVSCATHLGDASRCNLIGCGKSSLPQPHRSGVNASGGVTKSSRAVPSSVLAGGQRAMQEGQMGPRVDPKPLGNSYLMGHALRGHQRSSEAIRGHPRPSEVIRCHQRSSEVIMCSRPSGAHTGAQTQSDALRRNQTHQTQSDAIRRNQAQSGALKPHDWTQSDAIRRTQAP